MSRAEYAMKKSDSSDILDTDGDDDIGFSPNNTRPHNKTSTSVPRHGTRKRARTEVRKTASQACATGPGGLKRTRPNNSIVRTQNTHCTEPLSPMESLPNEIIQRVAIELETDTDLRNLNLSSPFLPGRISVDESDIWRARFLARYDHPCIDGPFDFSTAYKLRRLVLKNFITFVGGMNRRTEIQLEVLRDLVIETYFNPKSWQPAPIISRNLKTFESPTTSPWMIIFLSSAFPGITEKDRYGTSDSFFETMQIALSHLVLSPKSAMAHLAACSRDNYDISLVYNFDRPFKPLYICLLDNASRPAPLNSHIFPNLKPSEPFPSPKKHQLDTNSLLHIRNFWHRHLIDDSHPIGEHTYADMMRDLRKIDRLPKGWDHALDSSNIEIAGRWYGNYSCIHPWPKARKDLEERQSCAEDWGHVNPMVIDLVTSNDYSDGFWPPDFSDLPLFRTTIPNTPDDPHAFFADLDWQKHRSSRRQRSKHNENHHFPNSPEASKPIYIRGLAQFIDLGEKPTPLSSSRENHVFTSLRVRGVIHSIPSSSTVPNPTHSLPGWHRLAMIMYKPAIIQMIQTLEHATEDFGNPFATLLTTTTPVNTATIWSTPPNTTTASTGSDTLQTQLQTHLTNLLTSPSSPLPPSPSLPEILALEDNFSPPQHLTWDEGTVEFAYAYEGVVTPGGKIALGRWWRCHGLMGGGVGWEVDAAGERVGPVLEEDEAHEAEGGFRLLERGPFVFWC